MAYRFCIIVGGVGKSWQGLGFFSFLASHCLPFVVVVKLCVIFGYLA